LLQAVKAGLTSGVHNVFVLGTILMCIAFVATFFLKEIPLRGGKRTTGAGEPADEAAPMAMVH
jgi:hypothetical protein